MQLLLSFNASPSDMAGDPNQVIEYKIDWFHLYQGTYIKRGTTTVAADESLSYEAVAPAFFNDLGVGEMVKAVIVARGPLEYSLPTVFEGEVEGPTRPEPVPAEGGDFLTVY
jgi:hypothetical protein